LIFLYVYNLGTFSNSDESLLEGVDVIPKGHKMDVMLIRKL